MKYLEVRQGGDTHAIANSQHYKLEPHPHSPLPALVAKHLLNYGNKMLEAGYLCEDRRFSQLTLLEVERLATGVGLLVGKVFRTSHGNRQRAHTQVCILGVSVSSLSNHDSVMGLYPNGLI